MHEVSLFCVAMEMMFVQNNNYNVPSFGSALMTMLTHADMLAIYALFLSLSLSLSLSFSPPDINECNDSSLNNCPQICNNFDGGFNCSCRDGYLLNEDGVLCTGKGSTEQVAISLYHTSAMYICTTMHVVPVK